jgi:putative ABC transport system permease protein
MAWLRRDALDRDFDAELRAHLDLAIDDLTAKGLPPDEARRQARLRLGSVDALKEMHRETRGVPVMDTLWQDLRFAWRTLGRDLGFTLGVGTILAIGIGATTAVFGVFDSVLLRAAPVDAIHRLVVVWETDRSTGTFREPASVPDYLDFRADSRTLGELAALAAGDVNLTLPNTEPTRVALLRTSQELMSMLGLQPVVGRGFVADEDVANGPRVAMIGERLWERAFGRDPHVVGRSIHLNDEAYEIVGVAPDEADFGVLQMLSVAAYARGFADRDAQARVGVWLPLQPDPETLPRTTHPILVLGRLGDGATVEAAQDEMARIMADLERAYPENAARGAFVEPLDAVVFGPIRPALYLLLAAVGLVLVVACLNVAGLLLTRGSTRGREVAVRAAIGGSRARLAHQFLVEHLLLTLLAAAAGVAVALVLQRGLLSVAPATLPRAGEIGLDARVLGFTLLVSLGVAVVFGLVPTLQARALDLQAALQGQGGERASVGPARGRLRAALVVGEVALAVVLLVGAGLLVRSFREVAQVDPGFRTAGLLKAEYQLPSSRYPANFAVFPDFKEMHGFTEALLGRLSRLPGVTSAAIAGSHPLDPGFTNSFTIVGREAESRTWPEISVRRVSPGYFRTVNLQLVRGRLLADADATLAPPVAIVNEAAVERFFADRDPLGAQMQFWGARRTIVGVVANERFQGLTEAPPIAVYTPLAQTPSVTGANVLLVRTEGDPRALAPDVRAVVRAIDPRLAVFGVELLDETTSRSLDERRFTMRLLAAFAAVTLVLAAAGIHAALAFSVARRRRELGVRLALGAEPKGVLGLVLGEGLRLSALGLVVGLAAAAMVMRLFESLLFGVTPADPITFAASALFLAIVAGVSSLVPAVRAAAIQPATVLRTD